MWVFISNAHYTESNGIDEHSMENGIEDVNNKVDKDE